MSRRAFLFWLNAGEAAVVTLPVVPLYGVVGWKAAAALQASVVLCFLLLNLAFDSWGNVEMAVVAFVMALLLAVAVPTVQRLRRSGEQRPPQQQPPPSGVRAVGGVHRGVVGSGTYGP